MISIAEVEKLQMALDSLYAELLPFADQIVIADLVKVLQVTDDTLANVRSAVLMRNKA